MIRLFALPVAPMPFAFEEADAFMAEKLDRYEIRLDNGMRVVLRTPESLRDEVCGPDERQEPAGA